MTDSRLESANVSRDDSDESPIGTPPQSSPLGQSVRSARLLAIIASVFGVLLTLSLPFLPVEQDSATLTWPQNGSTGSVEAPLVSYAPLSLDVQIPCSAGGALADRGGVLTSTAPAGAADAGKYGLVARVNPATPDGPAVVPVAYAVATMGARADGFRTHLGLDFAGRTFDDKFLICDIKADIPDWAHERRFYFDPEWNPGRQVLIHPCPDSTFRIDWQVPGDYDLEAETESGALDRRIRRIIGAEAGTMGPRLRLSSRKGSTPTETSTPAMVNCIRSENQGEAVTTIPARAPKV